MSDATVRLAKSGFDRPESCRERSLGKQADGIGAPPRGLAARVLEGIPRTGRGIAI